MPFDRPGPQRVRRMCLPQRESLILDNAEGTTVAVDAGCLWVTMERDPRDIVLLPGMSFEIDRSGRTVIAAEDDVALPPAGRRNDPEPDRGMARASLRPGCRRVGLSARRDASLPYY